MNSVQLAPEPATEQGLAGRLTVASLVTALFLIACISPAVRTAGDNFEAFQWEADMPGWSALLLGWMSPYVLPWTANFGLALGFVHLLTKAYRTCFLVASVAFCLGLSTWIFKANEVVNPPDHGITRVYFGYLCWQAAMLVLALGSLRLWLCSPDTRHAEPKNAP